MTFELIPIIAAGLCSVAVFWCLPERFGQSGVAAFTAAVALVFAPATAIVMLASIVLVQQGMARSERGGWAVAMTTVSIVSLVAIFFASRELEPIAGVQWTFIGIGYSTLRHIHVLAEWRFGRIAAPALGAYFRYHLLLPVLATGPIHRLPHFERQCERRRWSSAEFFSGAKRALLGAGLFLIVGEYLVGARIQTLFGPGPPHNFGVAWLASAVDWVHTYATFAGLTDIALGFCLMMGLRLEENFNRPWLARDLIDFWTRWHITLSLWCRDYVYTPAAVWFRSPLVGIFCAMLALGLWHETSLYYVLWGGYQAAGIALSHLYRKSSVPALVVRLPEGLKAVLGPLAVLMFVSSARPVVAAILGGAGL